MARSGWPTHPNSSRQKDIRGIAPADSIILGDISFTHPYFGHKSFSENALKMIMFKRNYCEPRGCELELKISTYPFEHPIRCQAVACEPRLGILLCERVTCTALTWNELDTLFRQCFMWIFKKVQDDTVIIEVITTSNLLPIHTASNVMKIFFNSEFEKIEEQKFSAEDFFQDLKVFQNNFLKYDKVDVHSKKLLSKLRPYQCNAVQWMLYRECSDLEIPDWEDIIYDNIQEYTTVNGKNLYYNKYDEVLTENQVIYEIPKAFPSGILADEMGLGKTVVVIGLILNHPRDISSELNDDNYLDALEGVKKKKQLPVKRKAKNKSSSSVPVPKKQKFDDIIIVSSESDSDEDFDDIPIVQKPTKCTPELRCVCGDLKQSFVDCIQCPECLLYQHKRCVGYEKGFIYFCPSCWPKQKLIKSKGTLIVAPLSIYHQWKDEIEKHINKNAWARGVYLFNGADKSFVQPSVLSSYDVVITTYTCLPGELHRTEQNRRNLRPKRQFLRKCSPIALIEWWRVVLDEAQLVEEGSPNHVQISEMAKLIPAVYRWSVTGTPIQKSVNDLFYLMNWAKIKPFDEENFWQTYLYKPYLKGNPVPLYSVLSQVFWRNSKDDVSRELRLPEQTTEYHVLKFSAIEQSFYMREHNAVADEFLTQLRFLELDLNRKLNSLNRNELKKILRPFLSLRQACSHHLAVRNQEILDQIEYITGKRNNKKGKKEKIDRTMTLGALLTYLQEKTKHECEEALKHYFKALNGLGDVYSFLEDWPNAVKYYEEVLTLTKEYNDKGIKVDVLEKFHAVNNFAEVSKKDSVEVNACVEIEELVKEAKELEKEYLKKDLDEYKEQKRELKNVIENVSNIIKNCEDKDVWWISLVDQIISIGLFDKLVNSFRNKKNLEFLGKIMTGDDLKHVIKEWLKKMRKNREVVNGNLKKLCSVDLKELVSKGVLCHLKKSDDSKKAKNKCGLCAYESCLLDYENCLFERNDNSKAQGSSKPSNEENLLKCILRIGKSKNFDFGNGETYFELLEAFKEELTQCRAVWDKLNNLVKAKYQLSSAKSFLEMNKEKIEKEKKKLQADSEAKLSETKKKYGTLLYLKNLEKDNPIPDPCPICIGDMEFEWCVLQCGHSYCLVCTKDLVVNTEGNVITCPVCRELTKGSDIGFVSLKNKDKTNSSKVQEKHSTKVEAVIKTVLDLKQKDPKVKIIIFSTWDIVLKVLKKALDESKISYCSLSMAQKNYEVDLRDFKDPNLNKTVLLLPISLGCKGLNLTEATHVFLIEPVLNPAEELQAIGRVHRMGQTKKTVVHRFLVSGSIEEKIHSAVSEAKNKWAKEDVTLADLKNLFAIDSS